jgi:hypothetical protein
MPPPFRMAGLRMYQYGRYMVTQTITRLGILNALKNANRKFMTPR